MLLQWFTPGVTGKCTVNVLVTCDLKLKVTCTCVPMITASETGVYIVLLYTELRIISNQAYYLSLWREQSL